jgi:hypothetical protein
MATQSLTKQGLGFRAAFAPRADAAEKAAPWGFLEFFVISQTAFPAILFLPGTQAVRLPVRVAAYAISLLALAWWGRQLKRVAPHPAQMWLLFAFCWLVLMIFHPTTNTTLAGVAQVCLYLAVAAPVFWSPGLVRNPRQLERLLALLLICNGINSLVGVLQVYDPETWMPAEFSIIQRTSKFGLGAVSYLDDAGRVIVRPPGLFDNPGAVCGPGMLAVLLGLVFTLNGRKVWHKAGALAFAGLGLAAIYLSQVRTAVLIAGAMTLVYLLTLGVALGNRRQAGKALALAVLVMVTALPLAVRFGGQGVQKRFATLTVNSPLAVYYEAKRGGMVENAFSALLPQYPLGAGLARWGMMRLYFGDEYNPDAPLIWSEIQFPSWILDGGVPLLLLYLLALGVTTWREWRIVRRSPDEEMKTWGTPIFAANLGTLALIFSFTPFTAPVGMQYWFLAGVLHGAWALRRRPAGA